MPKSISALGVIAAVAACLGIATAGLAQSTSTQASAETSSQTASNSASSSASPPAPVPQVITVVGSTRSGANPNIRAVGMPDMLLDGNFALNSDTASASSCMFMEPRGSAIIGNEKSPFGNASLDSSSNRLNGTGCSQSDMNFAAGRSSIARRDNSLKDAFAAFDAKDYPTALKLFKASFNKMGYPTAALMVGRMYLYGVGTPQDVEQALIWFKKTADYPPPRNRRTGALAANFNLDNPDPMDAATDAAMTLGHLHLYGLYVTQDFKEARKWYTKANGWGFAPAGDILGQIYLKGYGVPVTPLTALSYFKKAGELGYGPAQYHMGLLYYYGADGISVDKKLAMDWFYTAAKTGTPEALYVMGRAYDVGEGVTADPQKAIVYYKEAAIKGNADAQNALATYFYEGQMVPQDMVTARKWFEQAAKQGQVDAMFNLAAMYYRGEGGEKDVVMAYVWFTLAKAMGHPQADAALKIIEPQLTPEQRAKADSLLKPPAAKP